MIHIKKLRVAYGSAVVIRDIELEAPRGEVTALVGPNGAGKTTTLKAIMGLVKHSGVIVVDGVDISHWAANKRAKFGIGLSPETRDLFPSLTVRENLILPIKALK
ncbi:MAG: ATP-binding cassette domain-containing protein, partial [Candidatus Aenigmatarchaeota archaeon]